MAYLRRQASSKFYYIQWVARTPDGKRIWKSRSTGETDFENAMQVLKLFNDAVNRRATQDRLASIIEAATGTQVRQETQLKDLWEWYISHCDVTGDERTQRDRRNALNRFIEWMGDIHPELERVSEVSLRIASEYWRYLANSGKSASTRNNNLSQLNTVWSSVHAPMELSCNPWDAIKRDTGGSIRYQPFTQEELSSLRQQAVTFQSAAEHGFWSAAIEIGYYTGLRLGDIATLDWGELTRDDEFLILCPNKTKHWGDDRVAVHSLSLPWVQMLPPQGEGNIWPKAAELYSKSQLSDEFTQLAKEAGIVIERDAEAGERRLKKVKLKTFHSLRHTFATAMLQAGISETDLKNQGNWSGTDVIDQHYNHAKLELAKEAARKIAEATTHDQTRS